MKRVVKYICILSAILCTLGFMAGVYADNEQGETVDVAAVAVEERLADINDRLAEVEKLKKDELFQNMLQNQRDVTEHTDSMMNSLSLILTALSILVALFGGMIPLGLQIKNNYDFEKIKKDWEIGKKELSNKQEEVNKKLNKLEKQISDLEEYTQAAKQEMQAYTYFAMGKNEDDKNKQVELYTEAIKLNPEYMEAYNNRANVYIALKDYEKAMSDLDKAIQLEPHHYPYANRGKLYAILNDYEGAIENYSHAIEQNPTYALAYNLRGYAYLQIKKYDEALKDCNKAIELNSNYVLCYNNRGYIYKMLGNLELAIENYSKALELKYNYALAYKNRGDAYTVQGEYDKAMSDYNMAIRFDPGEADYYLSRAKLCELQGDMERYEQDMDFYRLLTE